MNRLLLSAVTAAFLALGGTAVQAQTYGFGTMSQGTNSFGMGSAISKLMIEEMGIEARVQSFQGTSQFLPDLDAGALDFGIANVLETLQAYEGQGPWQGSPLTNIRVLTAMTPLRVAFMVAADSDIDSIDDLAGKRVTTRFGSIQTLVLIQSALLANGGLTFDDLVEVPVTGLRQGATAFLEGQADAFFFAVVPGIPVETHSSKALKVVPLDDSPEAVARMQEVFPLARVDVVPPIPPLPYVTAPTPAMAYDNLLVTGAHVPAEVVEQVAAGLAAGKETLGASFPPLRAFNPERIGQGELGAPFHDGVVSWLEKQ